MLNEMRLGRITEDTVRAFKALSRPLTFNDGLTMTELFPTRNEVDRSNEGRLRNLPGKTRRYEAHDSGDPQIRDKLLQNMMAPKTLDLKEGAQVMLIKNIDETLVNGSLGKVIGFKTEAMFEVWQPEGYGSDVDNDEARMKKKIKAFSRELDEAQGAQEFPVVDFMGADGSSRIILVKPEDWKVELPNGDIQAQRSQLPLILAWALSIHKAQGQTLERVKVDLGKVFEKGQAYVALSRAVSQQGLQVLRFEKHKVMAHPRVVAFYNKLYSAELAASKKPANISSFLQGSVNPSVSRSNSQTSKAESFASLRKDMDVIYLDDEEEAMASYGY
jgi:ATP-dependent DNA helicase PIF1